MRPRTRKEVLLACAELLSTKELCKGVAARDAKTVSVEATDRSAVAFCSLGLIHHVTVANSRLYASARDQLARALGWKGKTDDEDSCSIIIDWNDKPERTKRQVVAKFRKAAASL
jgi:hypothetical protein